MQEHAGCWGEGLFTSMTRVNGRGRTQGTMPSPLYHLARPRICANCIRVETGRGGWCSRIEFHYRHGVKPGADAHFRLHAFWSCPGLYDHDQSPETDKQLPDHLPGYWKGAWFAVVVLVLRSEDACARLTVEVGRII